MEVTSAVHCVGLLHLQTHVERLNNRSLFLSTRPRNVKLQLPFYHYHLSNYLSNHKGGCSDRTSVIINSTSSTASTATSTTEESLSEVEKIKKKCLTWQWKGQYSINYFVSSDSPQQMHANNPPLLLVHGFGASIAHWRR